jgi:serine protease
LREALHACLRITVEKGRRHSACGPFRIGRHGGAAAGRHVLPQARVAQKSSVMADEIGDPRTERERHAYALIPPPQTAAGVSRPRSSMHKALHLALGLGVALMLCGVAHADTRLIVRLRADTAKSGMTTKARIAKAGAASGLALSHVRPMAVGFDVVSAASDEAGDVVRKLRANPDVEFVDVDRLRHAEQAVVNDEFLSGQKYLTNDPASINAFSAWQTTHGSSNTVVAVVDTGYRPHAAMVGRFLPGYDMISDPTRANDGDGRDADASDPGDWVLPSEASGDCSARNSTWHGTGVAGIIAANTNDGRWTAGIDWNAKVLPVRVLGKCGGWDSDIVDGIAWAAGLAVPGVPPNPTPAHVINLSLGGDRACPSYYPPVIAAAYARGVTRAIVAAAGNESSDVAGHSPASCPGVIAVASTTTVTGNLARYSNFGAGITLSAPGGTYVPALPTQGTLVLSNTGPTLPGDDTVGSEGGTSFSAPMVSATISLMLAVAPALSPTQIVQILQATAKPFPAASTCTTAICGAGILDAGAAVRAAAALAPASATNYQGLWWAAPPGAESGWGLNLAHQGDIIFATWFTYDATGKPWWLSMTANKTAPNVYEGTLVQTQGPAFSAVPFNPAAVTPGPVGTATLTFSDANNAQFAYTLDGISQVKSITRELFGTPPSCVFGAQPDLALATNYQDLWWASPPGSESGWGINLTMQSNVIFATWFTYDVDGTPLWLSATASSAGPGVYSGALVRSTGPAFNSVPFNPAVVTRAPVGAATFSFSDGNHATFTYTVGSVTQSKAITREVFVSPGTLCQ